LSCHPREASDRKESGTGHKAIRPLVQEEISSAV
jgi:hypothetical protein